MPIFCAITPERSGSILPTQLELGSELDLNIDTSGEIELHQRVYRLRCRVNDVEETLMRAHLELLAALLVDVWGPVDRKLLDASRKRNGAPDACAGALRRRHDLARRSVENAVIERLQANADILAVHSTLSLCLLLTRPCSRHGLFSSLKADHRFQRSRGTSETGIPIQSSGLSAT